MKYRNSFLLLKRLTEPNHVLPGVGGEFALEAVPEIGLAVGLAVEMVLVMGVASQVAPGVDCSVEMEVVRGADRAFGMDAAMTLAQEVGTVCSI